MMSRQKCSLHKDVKCLHRRRITKEGSQSENYIMAGAGHVEESIMLGGFCAFCDFILVFLVFVRGMSSGVFALIISTSKLVTYMKSHSDIIQVHNEPEI